MLKSFVAVIDIDFYCRSPDSCRCSVFMYQLKIAGMFQMCGYTECVWSLAWPHETISILSPYAFTTLNKFRCFFYLWFYPLVSLILWSLLVIF